MSMTPADGRRCLIQSGLVVPAEQATTELVEDGSKRLGWLRHIDEPERLRRYEELLRAGLERSQSQLSSTNRSRMLMLDAQLQYRGVLRAAESTVSGLVATPELVQEFAELREVLEDAVTVAQQMMPVPEWPLALHRHYSRREILAAVGYMKVGERS